MTAMTEHSMRIQPVVISPTDLPLYLIYCIDGDFATTRSSLKRGLDEYRAHLPIEKKFENFKELVRKELYGE